MAYTVKKLSELSGVTVRTLYYYEEENLLKPAYYGSNGYRYYEEKELLQLQQILFFKALGFSLKQIRKVLGRSDFDQLAALHSHRQALSQEWEKMGQLIKTIDKTIKHLQGQQKMKEEEMFDGFKQWAKEKGCAFKFIGQSSEYYFIGRCDNPEGCSSAEALVLKNLKKSSVEKRDNSYYETIYRTSKNIYGKIAKCIRNGLEPESEEVQKLIKKHHAFAGQFHNATKDVYRALAQLYSEHPAYRKQLDPFHPQLAEFMAEAMNIFAERELM